jgi:serine/threonine protein kinase
MLEILEKIHYSGFTHNDLKLDNIMIGDQFNSITSLKEIRLVDFGFAAKYTDES